MEACGRVSVWGRGRVAGPVHSLSVCKQQNSAKGWESVRARWAAVRSLLTYGFLNSTGPRGFTGIVSGSVTHFLTWSGEWYSNITLWYCELQTACRLFSPGNIMSTPPFIYYFPTAAACFRHFCTISLYCWFHPFIPQEIGFSFVQYGLIDFFCQCPEQPVHLEEMKNIAPSGGGHWWSIHQGN